MTTNFRSLFQYIVVKYHYNTISSRSQNEFLRFLEKNKKPEQEIQAF